MASREARRGRPTRPVEGLRGKLVGQAIQCSRLAGGSIMNRGS
jgi:hypothetical protein